MGNSTPSQQVQNTSSQSTQQSQSGPPDFINSKLQNLVNSGWDYFSQNSNAPAYYPGSTVAGFSPQSSGAMGQAYGRNTSTDPLNYGITPNSRNLISETLGGKYLDINNNPYFQKALAAGFAPQNEAFNNTILPNLRSQFEGSGRNLGGADFDTAMRATKDLSQTQANAASTASLGAYNAERGNQNVALGLLPGMNAMDLANQQASYIPGAMQDQKAQQNIDADMARYNYGQTANLDWLTNMAQRLQGIYPGGQSSGSGTNVGTGFSTGQPATNPTASAMGAIMGGAGLATAFLPFLPGFGASDVRLKKNIKPIGKTDTGHNLYRYEFLGSDKPEIGVLAQEVEQKDPAAVVTHPAGFKMVNYDRIATTPVGGLL